jgi:hypothetical protein
MSHPIQNRDRLHVQAATPHGEDASPAFETPAQEAAEDYRAVRVHITNPVATSTADVQFGIYETFVLPASSATAPSFARVLPRDPLRQYAYITAADTPIILTTTLEQAQVLNNVAQAPGSPNNGLALFTSAKATPTIADQAISTLVNPPTGQYNLTVGIYLDGTSTAADEDNFQVLYNGATTWNLLYPSPASAAAGPLVYANLGTVSPNGSNSVVVRTLGIPSGTAVYHAEIILTPVNASPAVAAPNPNGVYLPAGDTCPPIRHNDPVWAVNTSLLLPSRVSIYVERGTQE